MKNKHKALILSTQVVSLCVLIYLLSFAAIYISMYKYAAFISSDCLTCGLGVETSRMSLLVLLTVPFTILLRYFKTTAKSATYVSTIIFMMLLLEAGAAIYESHVSNWSTFSIDEIYRKVLEDMLWAWLLAGVIYFYSLKLLVLRITERSRQKTQ